MKCLYVIQAQNGAIKIGLSQDPNGRLVSLRTGSPLPLRLIAVLGPGTRMDEIGAQRRFDHCRSHGEWFRGADVDAWVSDIFGTGMECVPSWEQCEWVSYDAEIRRRSAIRVEKFWSWQEWRWTEILSAPMWRWCEAEAKRRNPEADFCTIREVARCIFVHAARGPVKRDVLRPDLHPASAPQEAA